MQQLLNFDVVIEPLADGYRTRVLASPGGKAHAEFALPFTDKDLTILILEVVGSIGRLRRKVRRIQSPERQLLENFGGQLFQAVFSGTVRDCLDRSHTKAVSEGAGLRIRLQLPPELANIPWEYLYDSEYGFVSLSPETALVRYTDMTAPVTPFPVSPPLRILAMISAPLDVPDLQSDDEWAKLNESLTGLVGQGMVQVDRLEAGTLKALQRPLRLHDYHVLHFIGHGGYDQDAQDGALAVEGADGRTRLVTGRDLGLMLRGHHSLRMVVLNACEGARSAQNDPFGGVAQALVRQGIPAVIAMQFEISDPAALVFTQSFYQAIADGLPVDIAAVEARKTMFAEGNEVEWATPVLYLRAPDGRVFTTDRMPGADQSPGPPQSIEPDRRTKAERSVLYVEARAELRLEHFNTAIGLFNDLLTLDPGYADAAELRDKAQRGQQLADTYTSAAAAEDTGDWAAAARLYGEILQADPAYKDTADRKDACQKRQRVADLEAELRHHASTGQWQAVLDVDAELARLDPSSSDPDGLTSQARATLAAAERTADLERRYAQARDLANARDWDQAVTMFTTVADLDPGYRDVQQRLEDARKQQQIAKWQAEARRLHQAAQWAAVVEVGQRLHALNPAAADPEGLVTSARAELAAAERQHATAAERRAQASKSKMTRIPAPAVDVSGLAEALRLWYENQGLEAVMAATSIACTVQCRKRRTSKRQSEANALLTVILHSDGEDLIVETGSAKWYGKAALGASFAVVGYVPLAAAGVVAARTWQQHKLMTETISFLRETAPTHLHSAR
jgi:tetratricopeptide (TPR) repeat protein